MTPREPAGTPEVSRPEALRVWVRVALQSFGGPTGQIAVIHRIVVDEKQWLDEPRFLHALSYCMLLPGPEAQQLATYIGWLLHGVRGGLIAGLLFILPGFLSILLLSILYAGYRDVGLVAGLFFGLKPAVMAVVLEAILRLRRRALTGTFALVVAGTAFIAIFFLQVPFPLIVAGAATIGLVRRWMTRANGAAVQADRLDPTAVRPSFRSTWVTAATWSALWFIPLAALALVLGPRHVLVLEGAFFSKVAVVTFGGAYAVLSYVAQQAVEIYHWMAPGEMLDGLGMAETTPGPLIQVVQFVGFLGAFRHPGALSPYWAGFFGSIVTTWVTFVPCFFFIFVGAPYVEYLRGNRFLNAALQAIAAAVVGVVLNLAVWFALHTIFGTVETVTVGPVRLEVPELGTWDWRAVFVFAGATIALFRYKIGMLPTLGGAAVAGILLSALFP